MNETDSVRARHLSYAKRLVALLDTKYNLLGVRFGLDPLLDLIPGVGNIVGALVSFYLFWIARTFNAPKRVYMEMLANIAVDYVLGLIPFIGVGFDIFYRSNQKNYEILSRSLSEAVIEGEIVGES